MYNFRDIKHLSIYLLLFVFAFNGKAQNNTVYNWNWEDDRKTFIGTGIFFGASLYIAASADAVTLEEINALDRSKIWGIDASAIEKSDTSLKGLSDVLLFSSVALPFAHYFSPNCKKEGFAIAGMTFQAFFVSNGITNILKGSVQRLRPFTYNPTVSLDEKLTTNAKFSFVSGHTSTTALFSFLGAKIATDLYPEMKLKSVVWLTAAAIPLATGYLRYQTGDHFPTDIIGGYLIGATTGILLPHLYKNKKKDTVFNVHPVQNGLVLSMHKRI